MLAALGGRGMMNYLDLGLWTSAGYPGTLLLWSYGQTVVVHRSSDIHRTLTIPGLTFTTATPAQVARIMAAPEGSFPAPGSRCSWRIVAGALSERLFHLIRARLTKPDPHRRRLQRGEDPGPAPSWKASKTCAGTGWSPAARSRSSMKTTSSLPPGQLGQVRVSQTGIAGYLNDEAASTSFFRDDWFYPGDLGVLNDQGRLALFGRVTDVVNRQGDKLPAATFEAEMQKHLEVDSICLFSEQGSGADEELHVVIETPAPIVPALLKDAAKRCLGGFGAIHFHFLAGLPRNEMGKVQRLKLRQAARKRPWRPSALTASCIGGQRAPGRLSSSPTPWAALAAARFACRRERPRGGSRNPLSHHRVSVRVLLVAQKIAEFAQSTPDAPALIANLEPISFREFDRRIRALQHLFASRGLRPGGVAITYIGDLAAAWTADIALRGVGLTTMAIRSPAELEGLGGLEVAALVTWQDDPNPPIAADLALGAVRIALSAADWAGDPGDAPPLAAQAGDHILLTSGTTGHYKMIAHTAAQDVQTYAANRELLRSSWSPPRVNRGDGQLPGLRPLDCRRLRLGAADLELWPDHRRAPFLRSLALVDPSSIAPMHTVRHAGDGWPGSWPARAGPVPASATCHAAGHRGRGLVGVAVPPGAGEVDQPHHHRRRRQRGRDLGQHRGEERRGPALAPAGARPQGRDRGRGPPAPLPAGQAGPDPRLADRKSPAT